MAAFEAEYEIKVSDLGRTDLVNVVIADGKNADGESIPPTSGTSDPIPVEDVYTLTVRYLYSTGATAAAAYTGKYLAGEIYKVDSPSISGYNWSAAFVAGTMPAQDLTLDIIYTAQGGGGGTGGGGGEDPTPTPQPGDTPTPPVVPPVTPPVTPTPPATPVEPAGGENVAVILPEIDTAAVGDEPVPLGALVDVDDNGNVTLTPIEEDDVPLAGGEKSDKWALLNFALMNLAVFESLMLLIGYFVNTKNDNEEEEKRKLKKKGIFRVISLPIAVLALVVFILTEDITLPTGFVDKYTIFMVIIAIVQTVMVAFSRKKYEEEEEEEVTQSVQ